MSRRTPKHVIAWVAAGAGAVAVTGVVILFVGMLTPVSFGWFAYQPLAESAFVPGNGGMFVSPTTMVGAAASTVGFVALAFLLGWRLANRAAAAGSRPQLGE